MNLYQGCCHGCIYCDSRSACYRIEDFDRVRIKQDCISILFRELKNKREKGVIGVGAMSDCYNPFESTYKITRKALELIYQFGYGISIDTKSDLILRDIDILQKINETQPVIVKFTITTAKDSLSKKIEPYAPPSSKRFAALKQLSKAGIFTGVLCTPMLPFITDTRENIEQLVNKARESGAQFLFPGYGMTLRENQRAYYYEKLDNLFPMLKERYIKTYQNNYFCVLPKAMQLQKITEDACKKAGLLYRMEDIIAAYQKPKGYRQMSLL